MKNKLKKLYEKNTKTLIFIYLFLKTVFIIFRRYKRFKQETLDAIDTFETFNIKSKKGKKQFRKLIVFRYIYSIRANEYYLYDFEFTSDKKSFMTRQMTSSYYKMINNEKYKKVLDSKVLSYEAFKEFYKRDLICIKENNNESKIIFEEFVKKHPSFILKPFQGHGGEGVKVIDKEEYDNIDELYEKTLKSIPFVAEELIEQKDELGVFHKESVNTVRVVTFLYKNDISVLWTFLRTGQGNSKVDNMGSNGFGALVDEKTGKVISEGIDWKGEKNNMHLDSKIKFKGYKLPEWNNLLETVKNLASKIPEMHCVGWDMAYTKKGWVLVEANACPQCVTVQTLTKKGHKYMYDKMYALVKKEKDEKIKSMEG